MAEAAQADVVISTYALARRDEGTLGRLEWRGIVLDEAQNIKNPGAKQTQAIRRLRGGFRFALTGTPVENRLAELWSIMHFLNPGYLGSQQAFHSQLALPVERYQDAAAAMRLRRVLAIERSRAKVHARVEDARVVVGLEPVQQPITDQAARFQPGPHGSDDGVVRLTGWLVGGGAISMSRVIGSVVHLFLRVQ